MADDLLAVLFKSSNDVDFRSLGSIAHQTYPSQTETYCFTRFLYTNTMFPVSGLSFGSWVLTVMKSGHTSVFGTFLA